jgi:hypothetical protein
MTAKRAETPLLAGINGPADVRAVPEADLPRLAREIRGELIRAVSQTGGHLGPNLGVVELTAPCTAPSIHPRTSSSSTSVTKATCTKCSPAGANASRPSVNPAG